MIECPLCTRQLNNKLSYSQHLIREPEHLEFVENLNKSIIADIENYSISEIAQKNNLGQNWIIQVLYKQFSKTQIKQFKLTRQKNKPKIRYVKCICIICKNEFFSVDKVPRKTCNDKCKEQNQQMILSERNKRNIRKTLEQIYGQQKAEEIRLKFSKQRTKQESEKAYIKFYCKCGKFRKFKRDRKEEFVCRKCKQEARYAFLPCDNCGKTIKRLKSEIKKANENIKHVDKAKFFCNRKCYSEFYKNNPERYLTQRRQAGFASVKSFRQKDNFVYARIHFSSTTEMKCAQYIEKELGVVLIERQNCHVIIGKIEVDFLINNLVVEFHQCHRKTNLSLKQRIEIWKKTTYKNKFRYEYRTIEEYYKTRKKKLPKDYKLIVVETENEFHKIKETIC